jgi:hypothetical protein
LSEFRGVDGRVEPKFEHRVDLWSGAQAAAVAVPVIWFRVVNRPVMSRRYSPAESRWRPGRKYGEIPLKADKNR